MKKKSQKKSLPEATDLLKKIVLKAHQNAQHKNMGSRFKLFRITKIYNFIVVIKFTYTFFFLGHKIRLTKSISIDQYIVKKNTTPSGLSE